MRASTRKWCARPGCTPAFARAQRGGHTTQAEGCDEAGCRRAARWYLYRTFVATKYGQLGKGIRVQIPECAVAAIRRTFRAPGCLCEGAALARCTEHGYTGYKAQKDM